MATRQVRISGEKLRKDANALINSGATIILKNRAVFYGFIEKVEGDIFYTATIPAGSRV